MKIKTILFAAILLMATQAFAQERGKFGIYYDQKETFFEAVPTSPSDIIFLGNSITDGAEWSELFQNPHCKNRGISADIIPGVLNRLETVTKGQPAMVFLMIGTNDMNHGVRNDSIALGVRTIVQRIKEESPNTHIVVQSILPVNDCYGYYSGHTKRWQDVQVINKMLRAMAIEENVDYLDLYHPFATEEGKLNPKYSNDGLHLNSDGYQLWKNIIEKYYTFPRPVYKSGRVPIWLNLCTGLNVLHSFDQGASTLPNWGIGAIYRFGASLLWDNSYISYHLRGMGNIAFSNALSQKAFDFGIETEIEYLYRLYNTGNWHFWAGGTFPWYIDINYSPQLMNAALGYSTFFTLNAEGMAQLDFAKYDGAHHWFTAYAKLSLPLAGYVERPGFAYIDNYTESLTTSETEMTSNRESFIMLAPGVSTDIGLFVNLLNNNKIGLSYRWDYLTTRHKGSYRFDQANHSVNVTYMFNLK